MNAKTDYIAVFDSGVGGISVLRQLRALMPSENFLYFGDSANAPYGTRTREEIQALALDAAEKLVQRNIKALVVACNTATAAAIHVLRQTYPDLIVVGIEPALKPAADRYPGGTVGVLATPVTLREEKFRQLVSQYGGQCQVVPLPAPGLVELIEQGKAEGEEARKLLEELLSPWKGKLDALVLGCTHYPFAIRTIWSVIGKNVELFDGGYGTARETKRRLEAAGLLRSGEGRVVMENSLGSRELLDLSWELLG
jgi:glutamate racemase